MSYQIARTDAQVDQLLNEAAAAEENGKTKYWGMTFEQGVKQGIEWVTGIGEDTPPLP